MIGNPGAKCLGAWEHRMAARPSADRALIRSRSMITAIIIIIISIIVAANPWYPESKTSMNTRNGNPDIHGMHGQPSPESTEAMKRSSRVALDF